MQFAPNIYADVISSLIALAVLLCFYLVVNLLFFRKVASSRQKKRYQVRAFYVGAILYLLIIARIWVEGFMHLFAVLGLVSAALVVTNKELIMNFVGFLIINWRNLFIEGDLVQVQTNRGHVKSLGMLYFTLSEVEDDSFHRISGRIIRLPNGLVINNPVINYSQLSHLHEQKITIIYPAAEINVRQKAQELEALVDAVVSEFYKTKMEYSQEYLSRRNGLRAEELTLGPSVKVSAKDGKLDQVEFVLSYYCFLRDIASLENALWEKLFCADQTGQLKKQIPAS